MTYGWPYDYEDDDDPPSGFPAYDPARFEDQTICAACGRATHRDEARKLPDGAYLCDECSDHLEAELTRNEGDTP